MNLKTVLLSFLVLVSGCQSSQHFPAIRTATSVDLERFSGDWFVIANIPTFIETQAFNAVESYSKPVGGKIATTFSFNKGGFDGPRKVYNPTGFVRDDTDNAVWGMQFIWPFKAEYRIIYVDEKYETTIIGRSSRDYVWIMARQPFLAEETYQRLEGLVEAEGYDITQIRKVPHNPKR